MDIVRFGDLYAIPSGNGLSRPTAVRGEGYRMIGMGELFANDIISDTEMDRVQMSEREKKTFLVQANDLLFARQSLVAAGAGKCSIVKAICEPTTYESHLIRVRLDEYKCNPWFYYYFFKLPDNPIKAIVNQCAQAGIRGNELVRIKVPLPKRSTQDKIVSILSAYDNLIEVNNKCMKVLEQMAENLYKEWFVRFRFPGHENAEFENGIPKGWEYCKLDKLFDFRYGKDHKSIADGQIPIFGSGGLMRYGDRTLYNGESVLIPRKGTLNNIMYYNGPFWTVDTMFYTVLLKKHFAKYAYFTLSSIDMESYNSGAALPSMTIDILCHLKILVPDDSSLETFDQFVETVFKQKEVLSKANEKLARQRDLLLPRLMSGKLEV